MQLHFFNLINKKDIGYKMLPISIISLLLVFGENLITPIFSVFVNSITNNIFYTGIIISLLGFIGIFMSIPIGIIADKFNIKNVLLFSLGSFITIPILYVTFQSVTGLLVVRILSAISSSFVWCAVWTYIYSRVDEGHRAHEISIISKAMRVGSSLSPIIGGILAIVAFILPFYIVSLVFLFAFFVVLVLIRNTEPRKIDSFTYLLKQDLKILKDLVIANKMVILMSIVAYGVITSVAAFLPLLLKQSGFSFLNIGVIITLSVFPIFFVETLLGDFIDRLGHTKALVISLVILALTTVVLSITFNLFVLIPVIVIFGVGNTITFISFSSILSKWSKPGDRGLLSGTRRTLMSIGAAVGPFFSGVMLKLGGTELAMAMLAAISLVTALTFILTKQNIFNTKTS